MAYDDRAYWVSRLADVRTAIAKARSVRSYGTAGGVQLSRTDLKALLDEEKLCLENIEKIDASSAGGFANRVTFQRPT